MRLKKFAWWFPRLGTTLICAGLTLVWLFIDWHVAVGFGLITIAAALQVSTVWYGYMQGYYRGRGDALEAGIRSESGPEFARLLNAKPPQPWE